MGTVFAAVKALIHHQNKFVLLHHTHKGCVIDDLPGGRIEFGETPEEALHREVKEEIDCEVKIIKHVGVFWFTDTTGTKHVICNTYLCSPVGGIEIDVSKDPAGEYIISDYEWATSDELLTNTNLPKSLHEIIKNLDLQNS